MPIYEYQCGKCREFFEKIQRLGEGGDALSCPYCGEQSPQKIISCFHSFKKFSSSTRKSSPTSFNSGGCSPRSS